jgi:hypothetical protein
MTIPVVIESYFVQQEIMYSEAAYAHPSLQDVLTGVVRNKLGISGEEKQEVSQLSIQVGTALRKEFQKNVTELSFPSAPERIGKYIALS